MADRGAARAGVYLLRYWREEGGHHPPDDGWRFSLEDPRTGQRRGFASLAGLVAALEATTREEAGKRGPAPDAATDREPPR